MNATTIEFACPECQHLHRLPAVLEGRKGRCSRCRTVLRVREGLALRHVSSAERVGVGVRRGSHGGSRWSSPRVRPLIPALVAVALLGLASGTYAVTRLLSGPADVMACVPGHMQVVAQVQVREAIERFELAPLLQQKLQGQDLGLDPARDIERVTVAADPRQLDPVHGQGALVLIEGHFDLTRLQGTIRERGHLELETRTHCGVPYVVAARGDRQLAAGLLRSDLLALGAPADVEEAIETARGYAPNVLANQDLHALIREARGRTVWMVAALDDAARASAPQVEHVRSVLVSLDTTSQSLELTGSARFTDAAAAEQAEAALTGTLRDLGQGANSLPVQLDHVLQDHSVQRRGVQLDVELHLEWQRLEQAAQQARQ